MAFRKAKVSDALAALRLCFFPGGRFGVGIGLQRRHGFAGLATQQYTHDTASQEQQRG